MSQVSNGEKEKGESSWVSECSDGVSWLACVEICWVYSKFTLCFLIEHLSKTPNDANDRDRIHHNESQSEFGELMDVWHNEIQMSTASYVQVMTFISENIEQLGSEMMMTGFTLEEPI